MPNDLYVEVANFTVAKTFTADDKGKLGKAMAEAAKDALGKLKLTVPKKTATSRNFTLGGALTVSKSGSGANGKVAMQLNRLPKDALYAMATGEAETDDLSLVEDLAAAVVTKVVTKPISGGRKKAAAEP